MSVYVWGRGDQGQLGCGDNELFHLDPIVLQGFCGAVSKIACGDFHCLAVNEFGDVFAWGRGRSGQLGDGSRRPMQKIPLRVAHLEHERIIDVACGSSHCLAVTQEGDVYQWGPCHRFVANSNQIRNCQMPGMGNWSEQKEELIRKSHEQYLAAQCPTASGASHEADAEVTYLTPEVANFGAFVSEDDLVPGLVPGFENETIVSVTAGYSFSLALNKAGQLFSWGFNEKRQLGILHRFNQEKPQLIKSLADAGVVIVKVECGQQHVLALSTEGQVFSWGLGVLGQLGHGDCVDSGLPRVVKALLDHKIVDIACGSHHSVALTSDGLIFTWGSSEYGQLGGETDALDWQTGFNHVTGARVYLGATPTQLTYDFDGRKVIRIGCGDLHSIALTQTGEVYTWGWGLNGALGHGDRKYQSMPRLISKLQGEKIVNVAATSYSTCVTTVSAQSHFAFDFKGLVNSPLYSDITFTVKTRPILAHRAIIYPRCAYLQKLFEVQETNTLAIEDIEYHILMAVVKYLYCDNLSGIPLHHIPKVKKVGFTFGLTHLTMLCDQLLLNSSQAQPAEAAPKLLSTFSQDMTHALTCGQAYSDVEIVLPGGDVVLSHKILLVTRSDYFKTLFEGKFLEGQTSKLQLGDIDLPTLYAVLNFIYTNQIHLTLNKSDDPSQLLIPIDKFSKLTQISEENIVDVLLASGRFLLSGLKQKIESELERNLDCEIALDMLLISEMAQSPKLRKSCLVVIGKNFNELEDGQGFKEFVEKANQKTLQEIDLIKMKYNQTSTETRPQKAVTL